jgi:hypothetical protein
MAEQSQFRTEFRISHDLNSRICRDRVYNPIDTETTSYPIRKHQQTANPLAIDARDGPTVTHVHVFRRSSHENSALQSG